MSFLNSENLNRQLTPVEADSIQAQQGQTHIFKAKALSWHKSQLKISLIIILKMLEDC